MAFAFERVAQQVFAQAQAHVFLNWAARARRSVKIASALLFRSSSERAPPDSDHSYVIFNIRLRSIDLSPISEIRNSRRVIRDGIRLIKQVLELQSSRFTVNVTSSRNASLVFSIWPCDWYKLGYQNLHNRKKNLFPPPFVLFSIRESNSREVYLYVTGLEKKENLYAY